MKILHTADWHIGQFKGPVVDGVNLRSQDTVNCLNYMIKVAEEEKPDIVCVSGDVFHQEQIGPVRYSDEMIVATDTITKLAGVAKAVIVMRGTPNHDGGGQFRVLSKMFANTGNVHIVTSPTVLRTPYADIACIPGFDKQEFRSRFPGLSADEENEAWTSYISSMVMGLRAECHNTSILMAHYTVPGCNMESGQPSFFTNFEPVIPREALEAAGYEAVLLGHIHRPQQINGLHNVYYSGAINAMNFNDEYQNRGFYIHEFMGGEMTSSQFRKTPYRRFKTIDWDTNQVSDYIENRDAYALVTNISRDISDMIVRVKYSCTSEQKKLLNIPLLQKDLYDWGAFYVSDIEAENAIDVTNRGLLSEESDPTLNLKKYLEEKGYADHIIELEESSATVQLAAEALGVEPGMIAKTMSFLVDGEPILILTEGTAKVDNRKYKDLFHVKAKMIPFGEVEEYIGHAPGGVCPFGIKEGITVYLDESLKRFETVYPAAGNDHSAVRLTIAELEDVAGACGWIDVCKEILL